MTTRLLVHVIVETHRSTQSGDGRDAFAIALREGASLGFALIRKLFAMGVAVEPRVAARSF